MSHRAIFYKLEAWGFPQENIALISRMYTDKFLVVMNIFGQIWSKCCSRGVPQGAQPSSMVFNVIFILKNI
jgi:hypothetical protein